MRNRTQTNPTGRQPWRFTCRHGHHSWNKNSKSVPDRRYRCMVCVKHGHDDAYFAELVDKLG